MSKEYEGYIVHASYQTSSDRTRIFLVGRLRHGETFAIVEDRAKSSLFIRESDESKAQHISNTAHMVIERTDLCTIDGERCLKLGWNTNQEQQEAARICQINGIRTYEADLRFYDQFLIGKQIYGPCIINGQPKKGKHVDNVFINPEVLSSDWVPTLSTASIDIETNPETGCILSISIAFRNPWDDSRSEEVFFNGPIVDLDYVTSFTDEKQVLEAFRKRIVELDPDIITGWNVVEFDFSIIADRFREHGIAFTIGRSDKAAEYLPGAKSQSSAVLIPGRQVIDAMRIMRSGPISFEDNRLQTVAQEVIGERKFQVAEDMDALVGDEKIRALLASYRDDPVSFCRYSLEDAILVLRILDKTGMMKLTILRALLTGIGLGRAWTSVASFEFLYISAMRRKGLVAPTHGVDAYPVEGAAGGAIISPVPGFFDNVLVFDFKSLYPTIMRTFNIDPISFVSPQNTIREEDIGTLIQAPNGAYFRRDKAILPELLETFFLNREQAKEKADENASYVYKIIMNSFYGVLGSSGCRFAGSDIAGAITGFGHHFLTWCKDTIEAMGYKVIYGDTDSVFVLSGAEAGSSSDYLTTEGEKIAAEVNAALDKHIVQKWNLDSYLELEFEALYSRFFLPPIRTVSGSSNNDEQPFVRGRAKGYAGLKYNKINKTVVFDVKGIEAVRRDWTDAAKSVQVNLLTMIFERKPFAEVQDYLHKFMADLKSGKHDKMLIYKKALRKPVEQYTRSKPPHVQAAMALEKGQRKGVIRYVWTAKGPQPAKQRTFPIDYDHYIEKQLKPIVLAVTSILGINAESLFDPDGQMELF